MRRVLSALGDHRGAETIEVLLAGVLICALAMFAYGTPGLRAAIASGAHRVGTNMTLAGAAGDRNP